VRSADLVLLLANVLYGTSYLASRLALDLAPPATLALVRLVLAAALLGAFATRQPRDASPSAADRWRIAAMGVLGFSVAYALSNWGLQRSTVTNAALLIVVEPVAIILIAPLMLGERLGRLESIGAAVALIGTVLVVVNGIPGVSEGIAPHWQGDLLLVLAGVAFAAYTLIGRDVLARRRTFGVTLGSIVWGAVAIAPIAVLEWRDVRPVTVSAVTVLSTLYLGLVISGGGYLVWNWAIRRVTAPRAAVFLTVQPVVGALLGVVFLGEALTAFTVAGGALIVVGLALTVKRTDGDDNVTDPSKPDGILQSCPNPAGISSRTTPRID
jgi:drug/metabolite transporter (DMT)-like permease